MKSDERVLRALRWPRFDRYEITDGVVHPAADARLLPPYDPWESYLAVGQRQPRKPQKTDDPKSRKRNNRRQLPPYQELLALAPQLLEHDPQTGWPIMGEVKLTPGLRKRVEAWCRHNGLLGLLHHETLEVCLAPVWERDSKGEEHLHAVAHSWQRSGAGWVHTRLGYPRVTESDVSLLGQPVPVARYRELRSSRGSAVTREARLTAEAVASIPRSMLETIDPAGGVLGRRLWGGDLLVAPLQDCWRSYFPTRPQRQTPTWPLPRPHSAEFWRSYGEPLHAIVYAAEQLSWILKTVQADSPIHQKPTPRQRRRLVSALDQLATLTENTWPRADLDGQGKPQVRWAAPSLLGSFALMVMFDLAGKGTIRICARCATPFVSSAPQAAYCSDRCRNAAQQRVFRETHEKGG